jgi:isopentenyl-diphosphate Delta-isomerase
MMEQHIILVDHEDREIGTMEKMEAHRKGLLHRAFSIFIFNSNGQMLLQQRADKKYHSAGLWANACCSHPVAGENLEKAAHRRLKEELGFEVPVEKIFSFTYRSSFENGLIEHEVDHVFAGVYNGPVLYNTSEVKAIEFLEPEEIDRRTNSNPENFTSWFLLAWPGVKEWWQTKQNY